MKINVIILGILAAILCLSGCSSIQTVSSNYNPATLPSPTPLQAITDLPQIIATLNQLAEKSMSQYQQEGWWRRIDTVVTQRGDLHSLSHEEWLQLPKNQSECMIRMDISKDPDKGEIMNWQMQTAEGYLGNVITLRKGESEVIQVDPAVCRMTTETTQAGYLAKVLAGNFSGKESKLELQFAQAWYQDRNGKQVFFIETSFKTNFEKLTVEKDIYYFDMETGMAIEHLLAMFWEDGSQMGEIDTQSFYELWEEMPKEVAEQYQQGLEELKKHTVKPSLAPSADITTEPTALPLELESLLKPYTQENPLADEAQAESVMQEIVRRRSAWVARPGWLLQKSHWRGGKDYTNEQYTLVHITGDYGQCQEQMVYFYKDGKLSPWIVRLADGTSGMVPSWQKSQGNKRSNVKESTTCSLFNGESVFVEGDFLFVDETANLQKFIQDVKNGLIKGDFKIYPDELDGKLVLVLVYHTKNDDQNDELIMNASTQALVHFIEKNEIRYFDLGTGMLVWLVGRYTLENGSVDDGGGGLEYSWQFFTELPDEIQQAYTQAAAKLEAYLQP